MAFCCLFFFFACFYGESSVLFVARAFFSSVLFPFIFLLLRTFFFSCTFVFFCFVFCCRGQDPIRRRQRRADSPVANKLGTHHQASLFVFCSRFSLGTLVMEKQKCGNETDVNNIILYWSIYHCHSRLEPIDSIKNYSKATGTLHTIITKKKKIEILLQQRKRAFIKAAQDTYPARLRTLCRSNWDGFV